MSEHLGYDKHEPVGRNRGNSRNGTRSKTVLTDACGEVEIAVPRDRDGVQQVAAKHGAVASDDGLLIPMPQQTRGDALVDTIDRVQIGAELLRSLTGAGSNSTPCASG